MRHVTCAVYFAIAVSAFAAEPPTHTVNVVLNQHQAPSALAIQEMQREAATILGPANLNVKVFTGSTRGMVFQDQVVVVTLQGACDMDRPIEKATSKAALGWAHSADGMLLPFADLSCDNIRQSVRAGMKADDQTRANLLLGRAMGRVLAHELYHIIASTSDHGRKGVAQAAFSPSDLDGQVLDIDERDAEAVAESIRDRN